MSTREDADIIESLVSLTRDQGAGWPGFAESWFGGPYPVGQGQRRPILGWQCSGCGRGYAPHVRECAHCGPKTEQATSTNCCGPNGCEDAER
ncbi:MAG TPA: hypothetical protein VMV92_41505 [Streptosporangiaceae bacterium]|nr:hypothetical protein [Streptosporangiaceae bacterium]